jgi:hypothetical protein
MENELCKKIYQLVHKVGKYKRPKRAIYTDADIVITYLWAVLHDRPTCWACSSKTGQFTIADVVYLTHRPYAVESEPKRSRSYYVTLKRFLYVDYPETYAAG